MVTSIFTNTIPATDCNELEAVIALQRKLGCNVKWLLRQKQALLTNELRNVQRRQKKLLEEIESIEREVNT